MHYTLVLVKFNKHGEITSTGEPYLQPMTHAEVITFRSKTVNPTSWLIVEVTQEVLVQCRNYWLKVFWQQDCFRATPSYSFREVLYFEELIQNA